MCSAICGSSSYSSYASGISHHHLLDVAVGCLRFLLVAIPFAPISIASTVLASESATYSLMKRLGCMVRIANLGYQNLDFTPLFYVNGESHLSSFSNVCSPMALFKRPKACRAADRPPELLLCTAQLFCPDSIKKHRTEWWPGQSKKKCVS